MCVPIVWRRVAAQRAPPLPFRMALKAAWSAAADGRMAPSEQAKLWALREVLKKQGEDPEQYTWMASQVYLAGHGCATGGGHPGGSRVRKFFAQVDALRGEWYPGWRPWNCGGRPVQLTPKKRSVIPHRHHVIVVGFVVACCGVATVWYVVRRHCGKSLDFADTRW